MGRAVKAISKKSAVDPLKRPAILGRLSLTLYASGEVVFDRIGIFRSDSTLLAEYLARLELFDFKASTGSVMM